jgi:pyroglutamyl-peptidase
VNDAGPRILITGFEPFAGADDNPSARLVERLNAGSASAASLRAAVLPVSATRMPRVLAELLETFRPDVVLGLGEARGCPTVRVERVAVNLLDFRVADNDGLEPHNSPVVPGGPPAYFTTLPATELVSAIRAAAVPCETSLSAGSYLCNQMLYLALHWAAKSARRPRVGFLHLPSLPTQNSSGPGVPTMDLGTLTRALDAAVARVAGPTVRTPFA